MGIQTGITRTALITIGELLDSCAKIEAGQEVLLLAHIDGPYSGDNMVDEQAISWIQSAVRARGANASVLWGTNRYPRIPGDFLQLSRRQWSGVMY
jgi:hypothetical protein